MKRFGFFASAMVAAACFVVAAVGVAQGGAAAAATASSAPPAAAGVDPVPNLLKSPSDVARGKAIFVGTWIRGHILVTDKQLGEFVQAKRQELRPSAG